MNETTTEQTRKELQAELFRLEARAVRVRALIKGLDELHNSPEVSDAGKWSQFGIAEGAMMLLKNKPEGMKTRQIADELLKNGIRTRSQGNWVTNVYATLRAGVRFKVSSGTWTLTREGRKVAEAMKEE